MILLFGSLLGMDAGVVGPVVVTTRRYAIKAAHWRHALMLVIEE